MIYNRAVYDLTSVVKLVVDKIGPADRIQVLALLKNIKHYLETSDLPVGISYDEPVTSVSKLISSIEDISIAKQPIKGVQKTLKCKNTPWKFGSAAASPSTIYSSPVGQSTSASRKPPVFRGAGVKRPPPPDSEDDDDGGGDANDFYSEMSEPVEEVVIQDDGTDWQPIDMLERALTTIANEQMKTSYVFDGKTSQREGEKKKIKERKTTKPIPNPPKLYLPDEVEFVNPTPRMVAKEGDRKWPENVKWICVYCRLISMNLACYKAHLRVKHKQEDQCCCKHCKRLFPNVELFKFHWCKHNRRCNICHLSFNRPNRYRKHMDLHYKSYVGPPMCRLCDMSFTSATQCAVHIFDDHEMIIMCDSCLAEFDPSESAAVSPSRLFCKRCSETVTDGEPEDIPGNVNPDIVMRMTKSRVYKKRDTAVDTTGEQNQSTAQSVQFCCEICDVDMPDKESLKQHLQTPQHADTIREKFGDECPYFACDDCGKQFVNEEYLAQHVLTHRPDSNTGKYKCKICSKEVVTFGGYKNHMTSHINPRDFECNDCGKMFNQLFELKDHMDNCHDPDKWFPCSLCREKFKTRRLRLRHVDTVHHNYVFVCPHCDYKNRDSSQLKNHFAAAHPGETWTRPRDFRKVSEDAYVPPPKREESMAESVQLQQLHCELCDIDLPDGDALQQHLKSPQHADTVRGMFGDECPNFACNECGKLYVNEESLAHHVLTHRSDSYAGKYKCKICSKELATVGGYKNHMTSHMNPRDFDCGECGKMFNQLCQLKDHMDNCHNPDKWFPCSVCNEKFNTRRARLRHVDTVHHNYVFVCPYCDYESRDSSQLRDHFALMHPDKIWTRPKDFRQVSDKPYIHTPRRKKNVDILAGDKSMETTDISAGDNSKETTDISAGDNSMETTDISAGDNSKETTDISAGDNSKETTEVQASKTTKPEDGEHADKILAFSRCDKKFTSARLKTKHENKVHAAQGENCEGTGSNDKEKIASCKSALVKVERAQIPVANGESTSAVSATPKISG